jgi:hypothetical protein
MDFSRPRVEFIPRKLLYACSFDFWLQFERQEAALEREQAPLARGGLRDTKEKPRLYHVLDAGSVEGVDGRRHPVPNGKLLVHELERVDLDGEQRTAAAKGRLAANAPEEKEQRAGKAPDADPDRDLPDDLTIEYDAVLAFHGFYPGLLRAAAPFTAKAQLVLEFGTDDTRFRWLVEHATVGFGTWEFQAEKNRTRAVIVSVDVYSAG